MRLSDLGEKEIIARISRFLDIGDDAAYIKMGEGYLILSTDMFYSDTHLLPGMSFEQVGMFIVSVNLSDIASMGAKPFAFMLAYGGPDTCIENFEALINAAEKQCSKFGVKYVGGDTKYTQKLTLTGTAAGLTGKPILRSGAREGDVIAVTGYLGTASFAIDCLLENRKCPKGLIKKAMEPEPRVEEGVFLNDYASAMTDISDSLAISLYNICSQSNTGAWIDTSELPVADDLVNLLDDLNKDPLEYVLYGGGDYELVFTVSEDDFEVIKKNLDITRIGEVTHEKNIISVDGSKESLLQRRGYEHFRKL